MTYISSIEYIVRVICFLMDCFDSSSEALQKEMGGYKILHDYFFSFSLLFRSFTTGFVKCISAYHILSSFESYTFNVINSILTKPVGGILFGVAFWMVGRSISDKKISDYMQLSAIGIMLLSISNQDAGLYLLPYPPFGLPTITFVGISSYLLFVGIYYSSISVSMNTELRKTIENSVEEQFKFVSKIGRSQMEKEIESRVKGITKRSAKILEENSGIEAPVGK